MYERSTFIIRTYLRTYLRTNEGINFKHLEFYLFTDHLIRGYKKVAPERSVPV